MVCLVLATLGTGAYLASQWMYGPRYRVGAVAGQDGLRSPLDPPVQLRPETWQVAEDITLYHESHGAGRAVLVIHGGPGIPARRPWRGLRDLEDEYEFHYYHQRGCGLSTRPFDRFDDGGFYDNMVELERTLGLGAQVADIERIRRILGEEQLVLIGHSFGGFLAALYAAEFPERVERLVLVAPAGILSTPDEERDIFEQTRLRLPVEERAGYDDLRMKYMDFGTHFSRSESELARLHLDLGAYIMRAMNPGAPAQGALDEAAVSMAGGWSTFAQYFSLGKQWDFRGALDRIAAPTLILYGADDEMSAPGSKSYMGIAGAEIVRVAPGPGEERAGHLVFDQCPTTFAETIEAFLGTAPRR